MADIDELFRHAIQLKKDERIALLESLDADTRCQLGELLSADLELADKNSDFLNHNVVAALHPADVGSVCSPDCGDVDNVTPVPDSIGPYRILKQIGTGGQGQVFLAEQKAPIQRLVALKIVKTETPTKDVLMRFDLERQALAMMDHDNIARVFDAGVTDNGRPYFVMELVEGTPITEYCDANRLKPENRLQLFCQACRAIQHAHQKGVIHRDVKPSNILVSAHEGEARVKVIDFGLAKALHAESQLSEHTMQTEIGQIVGTLAYMSPEQAEFKIGNVDAQTDVYSLGVVLYELLTGSTPVPREIIQDRGLVDALSRIRDADTPRPSERLKGAGDDITRIALQRGTGSKQLGLVLKSDLDWIVLKALEKDRERRYESPSGLANDITRFWAGEPIEARPPSNAYRLKKALLRNKRSVTAATLVLVALVGGLISSWIMYQRASNAETRESKRASEAIRANEELVLANARERERADEVEQARKELAKSKDKRSWWLYLRRVNDAWSAYRDGEHFDAEELLLSTPIKHRDIEFDLLADRLCLTQNRIAGTFKKIALSPTGNTLVTLGPEKILYWDTTTGECRGELFTNAIARNASDLEVLSNRVVIFLNDRRNSAVYIRGNIDDKEISPRALTQFYMSAVATAVFEQGETFFMLEYHAQGIRVWSGGDTPVCEIAMEKPGHCKVSPDGKAIAVLSSNSSKGRVVEVLSGKTICELEPGYTSKLYWVSNSKLVQVQREFTLKWDLDNMKKKDGAAEKVKSKERPIVQKYPTDLDKQELWNRSTFKANVYRYRPLLPREPEYNVFSFLDSSGVEIPFVSGTTRFQAQTISGASGAFPICGVASFALKSDCIAVACHDGSVRLIRDRQSIDTAERTVGPGADFGSADRLISKHGKYVLIREDPPSLQEVATKSSTKLEAVSGTISWEDTLFTGNDVSLVACVGDGGLHQEKIAVWDCKSGNLRFELTLPGYLQGADEYEDGYLIGVHVPDGADKLLLLDKTGKVQSECEPAIEGELLATCRFSPDNKSAVLGTHEGSIGVVSFVTGKTSFSKRRHQACVRDIQFSTDTSCISFADDSISHWNVNGQNEIAAVSIPFGHDGPESPYLVLPGSSRFAAAARIWDKNTGDQVAELTSEIRYVPQPSAARNWRVQRLDKTVNSIQALNRKKALVSAQGVLQIIDLLSGEFLDRFPVREEPKSFVATERTLTAFLASGVAVQWNLATGEQSSRSLESLVQRSFLTRSNRGVLVVDVSGQHFSFSDDSLDAKLLGTSSVPMYGKSSFDFCANASAQYDDESQAIVISYATNKPKMKLLSPLEPLRLTFSTDGRFLLSQHIGHSVTIWSTDTGKVLHRIHLPFPEISDMDVASDGQTFAYVGTNRTIGYVNLGD